MVSALHHRGPDNTGILVDQPVILGHSRLSIIDLSTGDQPMGSEDERLWIVFNGEIFNYVELRDKLIRLGHRFLTSSDTEVILVAYRQWGTNCFQRFNGQWAVAIWDRESGTLVLSRDRVGIRPLYYTWLGKTFIFASEIKALFQIEQVERRLDAEGINQTFTYWCPVAPATTFFGVFQVEPGSCLELNSHGKKPRHSRYWAPTFSPNTRVRTSTIAENVERFRQALIGAAQLRFDRSDVPVGAYLSGGIDSSVTTAILARHTSAPLCTFSVAFTDAEFDESPHQKMVARHLGTHHQTVTVSRADIGAVFPNVVLQAEQPLLRTAPAPLFLLSRLVRDSGYKVVVTGEGADEVLGGYDIFREAAARRYVAMKPNSERRREILLRLYPWMKRSPANTPAFAKAFFSHATDLSDPAFSHRPRWHTSATLLRLLHPEFGAEEPSVSIDDLIEGLPDSFATWRPLERAQYLEITTLLSGYILSAQGDRMLMAHSVEGRFPFLDHEVISLASQLPPRQKLMGLDEKYILKQAFGDLIPLAVVERPKQPYRSPDASSFFAHDAEPDWLKGLLCQASIEDAGIFRSEAVQGLLRKCRADGAVGMSNTDNMRIVSVISTMLLYHQFVASRPVPGNVPDRHRDRISVRTLPRTA